MVDYCCHDCDAGNPTLAPTLFFPVCFPALTSFLNFCFVTANPVARDPASLTRRGIDPCQALSTPAVCEVLYLGILASPLVSCRRRGYDL